jgi:hypothetical protein
VDETDAVILLLSLPGTFYYKCGAATSCARDRIIRNVDIAFSFAYVAEMLQNSDQPLLVRCLLVYFG